MITVKYIFYSVIFFLYMNLTYREHKGEVKY